MHQPIVRRSPRFALSTLLPLCLVAASAGLCLPLNAAVFSGGTESAQPHPPFALLSSGIRGRVVLGPVKPSSTSGESAPERPLQTTLDIVKAEDKSLVKQVRTRPDGTFMVGLAPGDYIVRWAVSDETPPPSIKPVPVTVRSHTYVVVTINADSGIR